MKLLFSFAYFTILFISFSKCNMLKKTNSICPLESCKGSLVGNKVNVAVNGCGGDSKNSKILEFVNKLGNSVQSKFVSCCNAHDTCYGTCRGTDSSSDYKSDCDDDFYNCMKSKCKSDLICKSTAKLFYKLVDEVGVCFFNESQNTHCDCKA